MRTLGNLKTRILFDVCMCLCFVGDKAFKPCKETDKPSATIDDLEEDEEIEFRVAAVNEAGRSMPSPPLKVKVKEPEC